MVIGAGVHIRTKTTIERAIRWPPAAVRELAKNAMEWAGEPQALYRELGADLYPVPNVEGSNADKCQLTKYSCGKRFARKEVNEYLGFLFEAIAELAPSVGLNVSISRYDLFHGHLFTAYASSKKGMVGGKAIWAQFLACLEVAGDHNQGTLVVFKVDPSLSLDSLRKVFEKIW